MAGNEALPVFDVGPVLEFASLSMAEGYTVSLQWFGHMDAGQASGLKELLHSNFRVDDTTGSTVRLVAQETGSSLQGTWSRLSGGHEGEAFLRLEADGAEAEALAAAGSRIDGWLREAGAEGDWSVKAAGVWKDTEALQPERAVSGLAETLLAAQELDTYKDQGIVNTLYKTERTGLKAAGTQAGLQTALHRNSETGGWNLAVGAPMLTGEF
jgi:hypothetical protein